MSNDVSVIIDVANQSITSSNTNIITVPTQNFEVVTFDNKPCIRATNSVYPYYATFTLNPTIKSFSCDVFLQAVSGFTLLIEFDTILNTKYSLVYYPNGVWWNPDRVTFDSNNVLIGVWVTVTYSSTDKTITFDNGTTRLIRAVDSSIADFSICTFDGSQNIYLTNLGAETSSRYLNGTGLSEVWTNTKNYISAQLLGYSQTGHTHSASDITSGLAIVATSGSYNDLSNKPTIPSKTSDLTNDSGFITRDNTKIPLTGTNALAGSIVPSTDNSVNLGDSTYGFASFYVNKLYLKGSTIFKLVDDSFICLGGATAQANGANLVLNGKYRSTSTGEFKLEARDGTNTRQLIGKPDGTLSWNNKNVAMQEDTVPRSGGAVMTGNFFYRAGNDSFLAFTGANAWAKGGGVAMYGPESFNPGELLFVAALEPVEKQMRLKPDGTWTWQGQACQLISDQRYKQQINAIDDKLLDAWEDVDLVQFKYNDAVKEKSDNARLHTGYVVQQIDEACKSHNVDISAYGLYCHEEYPEETEEVEVEQADGTKVKERKVIREASEHYSLRYTEVYAVECMYLRRCIKQLTARIEELEKGNNVK